MDPDGGEFYVGSCRCPSPKLDPTRNLTKSEAVDVFGSYGSRTLEKPTSVEPEVRVDLRFVVMSFGTCGERRARVQMSHRHRALRNSSAIQSPWPITPSPRVPLIGQSANGGPTELRNTERLQYGERQPQRCMNRRSSIAPVMPARSASSPRARPALRARRTRRSRSRLAPRIPPPASTR